MANNKGGLLIFGIENVTKELVSIKSGLENPDNRYLSSTIRRGLDGTFEYFFFTGRFLTKIIGFLYVAEAVVKPVIIRTNSSDLIRGEIHFRYSAQITSIEASDLQKIIDDEVKNKLTSIMTFMHRIAAIGPDKIALLNTESGEIEVDNKNNTKLILNPESLKELNLIKEGKLVDSDGAPACTIKGQIEIKFEESEKLIEISVPTLVKESEIYKSFFAGGCEHPKIMLE